MQSSKRIITGIDEVGRGSLAGPVVACALVFSPKLNLIKDSLMRLSLGKFKDSKRLTSKQREYWYNLFLKDSRVEWGIGKVSEKIIDKINIRKATKLAMERAVYNLSKKIHPTFLYIDGTMKIKSTIPQKTVIKGDEKIPVCAMASIVAKVTRDRLMIKYDKLYPKYGFSKHKGYGTLQHFKMLKKHGPCPIHRKTFSPINSLAKLRISCKVNNILLE